MNFNGIDVSEKMNIKQILGRGVASYELSLSESAHRNGAFYQKKKKRSPRPLKIVYQVIGQSLEEIRSNIDDLNGVFDVDEEAPIIFSDEPNKVYYGLPQANQESSESFIIHEGTLTILCPNPDKFNDGEITRVIDGTSFTYEGTAPTFPIVTVNFTEATSSYEVSNQEGKSVKVNYDFQSGDELELNFATQKVSINGNVQMTALAWKVSKWFQIKPGENTLTSTHLADMNYKVRWL